MKLTDKQLGAELSTMRPAASPEFLAALDARVRTPGVMDRLRSVRLQTPRPQLRLAFAAAVVVVGITGIVVAGSLDSGLEGENSSSQSTDDRGVSGIRDTSGAGAAAAAPESATAPSLIAPSAPRKVERNVSMTLSTEPGKVADVSDGIVEVTDRYRGFVVSSNVHTGDGSEQSRATFQIKVPTARLQDVLADLSSLAHVQSRNEGSLDITAPYVSAREQLTDAQAKVDGLLEQLAEASSPTETDAIQAQLRAARDELSGARAQVDQLNQRAELSTLDITVAGNGNDGDGSWGIDDAADDAVSVLRAIAGAAIVSLAVIVPLGLLAALIWWVAERSRRRGRERALDE